MSIKDLKNWAPSPTPLIDLPPVETLTGGFSVPPWVVQEYHTDRMQCNVCPLYTFSIIGTVYRLWVPNQKERTTVIQHIMEGTDISFHLRRWIQNLPDDFCSCADGLAVNDAFALMDELASWDGDPEDLFFLAERRDILEGVLRCLEWVGLGEYLRDRLQGIDRWMEVLEPKIQECKTRCLASSPRIWAVSWQYPNAWWGKLNR